MVKAAVKPGSRGLGLVPAKESHNSCSTHSRQTEHNSRQGVSQNGGFQRLEVESKDFLYFNTKLERFCSFPTQSSGRSYGCISSEMESVPFLQATDISSKVSFELSLPILCWRISRRLTEDSPGVWFSSRISYGGMSLE